MRSAKQYSSAQFLSTTRLSGILLVTLPAFSMPTKFGSAIAVNDSLRIRKVKIFKAFPIFQATTASFSVKIEEILRIQFSAYWNQPETRSS
jgi:hypothetical protein